jgi:outer membrane protein TolC
MQRAFASERTDFLDVIDPERTLLEFQTSFERALADSAQHLARIDKLIG